MDITKDDLYKPVVCKCFDWCRYTVEGFFSHKFKANGRIGKGYVFCSFADGNPDQDVIPDMESFSKTGNFKHLNVSVIEKRKAKTDRGMKREMRRAL